MTAIATEPMTTTPATRGHHPVWRIVRLHAVSPTVFFGIPWMILAGAWVVSMLIGFILVLNNEPSAGMSYSWAVVAPQWYLVVVGVQAVAFTFPFALGFGATRRDFWLGTCAMFVLVSLEMAVAIATLVKLEIVTGGWGIGAHMFDALWYGEHGWLTDFYATFCLQLLVLFIGAAATTVYMRWRNRGMLVLTGGAAAAVVIVIAAVTFSNSWALLLSWFAGLSVAGAFTLVLIPALLCAGSGYLVIRRATTR